VKIHLTAAALLLGGAAFLVRGEKTPPVPAPTPLRMSAAAVEALEPVTSAVSAESEPKAVKPAVAPAAADAAPARPLDSNAGFVGFLTIELALSEEQTRAIAGVLEDRARAVSSYEAEVQERGWFRMEDFNHRVDGLREISYRRVASLLDADQARAFAALWPVQLLAKDCIVVALPEEHVVTLD
jgi:hypothetical protein